MSVANAKDIAPVIGQDEKIEEKTEEIVKADSGKTIAGLPILHAREAIDHTNYLIYGDPGSGKTTLAASASIVETMTPVLLIDVEGGTKSIRKLYPDIDIIRVKTIYDRGGRVKKSAWDQLNDIYEHAKLKGEYGTYIIDSLSEVYWINMADWMVEVLLEHPERDADIPAQKDYLKAGSRTKKMVRQYRDLDANVIFTALKATITNDSGGLVNYTPALPGKLAYEIAAFVDEVFYLYTKTEKEETKRVILTENANKYLAKDRSDNLPRTVDRPTMAGLSAAILD